MVEPIAHGCEHGFGAHIGFWCLVRPEPNQTRKVALAIRDHGAVVYLPMAEFTHYDKAGRLRRRTSPLFAGYIFAATTLGDLWGDRRLGRIEPVRDQWQLALDLHRLKAVLDSGAPIGQPVDPVAGQKVRVVDGPMVGLIGVVRRVKARRWMHVDLEVLGRTVPVDIQAHRVEAYEGKGSRPIGSGRAGTEASAPTPKE